MSAISVPQIPFHIAANRPDSGAPALNEPATGGDLEQTREAFQKFVAGTFYKQMLKSLRQTQGKPAYFHGGQAEEIFRGQMDQEVAEQLAESRGGSMSDSLFEAFATQLRLKTHGQPPRKSGNDVMMTRNPARENR